MYLGPINAEWVLLIVIAIVGFIVQAKLQSVFKKYSKVMFPGGLTGKDVAERMLHDNGIYDVKVVSTPGHLTDHYNPATKTVNLSESVYSSNSVAAAGASAKGKGKKGQESGDLCVPRREDRSGHIGQGSVSLGHMLELLGYGRGRE